MKLILSFFLSVTLLQLACAPKDEVVDIYPPRVQINLDGFSSQEEPALTTLEELKKSIEVKSIDSNSQQSLIETYKASFLTQCGHHKKFFEGKTNQKLPWYQLIPDLSWLSNSDTTLCEMSVEVLVPGHSLVRAKKSFSLNTSLIYENFQKSRNQENSHFSSSIGKRELERYVFHKLPPVQLGDLYQVACDNSFLAFQVTETSSDSGVKHDIYSFVEKHVRKNNRSFCRFLNFKNRMFASPLFQVFPDPNLKLSFIPDTLPAVGTKKQYYLQIENLSQEELKLDLPRIWKATYRLYAKNKSVKNQDFPIDIASDFPTSESPSLDRHVFVLAPEEVYRNKIVLSPQFNHVHADSPMYISNFSHYEFDLTEDIKYQLTYDLETPYSKSYKIEYMLPKENIEIIPTDLTISPAPPKYCLYCS